MASRRQERVGKRILQELVDAVRNLKNVTLGFITLTKCEVSPDLRHAKVFVSVWGADEEKERSLAALKQSASKLKGMIGRPLGTKVVPDLHFEFDESLETADRMSRLIRDARASDLNPNPLSPEEAERLAAAAAGAGAGRDGDAPDARDSDAFDAARLEVEEELFGDDDDDDDPDWRPINLDELPDDGDDDEEDG